jgi:hypothetical protein
MTQAAAVILGLSLILAGIALVGDALGLWKVPGDFWAAVIVLLGAAGRYAASALGKGPDDDDGPPPPKTNGEKIAPIAVVLMIVAGGCSGPLAKSNAEAWARCAGGGALTCVPSAQGEPAQAAIQYAACISAQAIRCAGPLVAQQNPPIARSSPIDPACVSAVAKECHANAQREAPPALEYRSQQCIETRIARCWH